jgi:TfoX/Sxy family transcriptional regulator of competence genes
MPPDAATTALLERVRELAQARGDVEERRMVGGRSFVRGGTLCCGVTGRGLLVRAEGATRADALARPHVEPARMGSKDMAAYVLVHREATSSDADLAAWLDLAFTGRR